MDVERKIMTIHCGTLREIEKKKKIGIDIGNEMCTHVRHNEPTKFVWVRNYTTLNVRNENEKALVVKC